MHADNSIQQRRCLRIPVSISRSSRLKTLGEYNIEINVSYCFLPQLNTVRADHPATAKEIEKVDRRNPETLVIERSSQRRPYAGERMSQCLQSSTIARNVCKTTRFCSSWQSSYPAKGIPVATRSLISIFRSARWLSNVRTSRGFHFPSSHVCIKLMLADLHQWGFWGRGEEQDALQLNDAQPTIFRDSKQWIADDHLPRRWDNTRQR